MSYCVLHICQNKGEELDDEQKRFFGKSDRKPEGTKLRKCL